MEDEDIELVKALDDNGKLTQNPTTSKNDTSTGKMKWTGKTCLILAVLIATIAILVFAVLVAIIIVNPQARELNTEIQTLKQQVENLRKSVTQIQQNLGTNKEELSGRNVKEDIANINASLSESLNQHLSRSLTVLHNELANVTMLIKTASQRLDQVESRVNLTQSQVKQINLELPAMLGNVTEPLAMSINHLRDQMNKSLDTLELQLTNNIHVLEQELNQSNNKTHLAGRALTCDKLSPPDNGEISVAPGPNSLSNGLGSVATYSCDLGYGLVGQDTRTCEDLNGGTVTTGTWSETPPACEEIFCIEPMELANGMVTLSSQLLDLGTTATYSCNSGYVLVGETNRTCEMPDSGAIGIWSGYIPICEGPLTNCHERACCSGYRSCIGKTIIFHNESTPILDCGSLYSCQYANIICPANNLCTIDCTTWNTCQYSTVTSLTTMNCDSWYTCQYATLACSTTNICTINCDGWYACQNSEITCPTGNNCYINCDTWYTCNNATVICPPGDYSCNIHCTGRDSCSNMTIINSHNVNLRCCGTRCEGTNVVPTSRRC